MLKISKLMQVIFPCSLFLFGGFGCLKGKEQTQVHEGGNIETLYATNGTNLPFTILGENTAASDPERVLSADDWAYIRGTIEQSWNNAGKLLKMEFTRLSNLTENVNILVDHIEIYTKDSAKVLNFEVGVETTPKNGEDANFAKVTFSGISADILANVKIAHTKKRGTEAILLYLDTPFRYAKLKPGLDFGVEINDILAHLIGVPGIVNALDWIDGMLGSLKFKAKGKAEGTTRFMIGEDRRNLGVSRTIADNAVRPEKYSDIEYHLATEIFSKICKEVLVLDGKMDLIASECAPIFTPSGSAFSAEIAKAYNTMPIMNCIPRVAGSSRAMENINHIYDWYAIAPSVSSIGVDLMQKNRKLRIYADKSNEYVKIGDYATIENPSVQGMCGSLKAGERCVHLRFGRSKWVWQPLSDLDNECAAAQKGGKFVASFNQDDSFRKPQ